MFLVGIQVQPFCVECACCPGVCLGLLWELSFLPQSKDVQIEVRLIGDSKLAVGMKVYVSPVIPWQPDHGVLSSCPMSGGIDSSSPTTVKGKAVYRMNIDNISGWILSQASVQSNIVPVKVIQLRIF